MINTVMRCKKIGGIVVFIGLLEIAVGIVVSIIGESNSFIMMGIGVIVSGLFLYITGVRYIQIALFILVFFLGYEIFSIPFFLSLKRKRQNNRVLRPS